MDTKVSGSNLVYILPKQPTTAVKPVITLSKPLAKIAPLSAPAKCTGTPPLKPPKREREEDNQITRCKRRLDFAKLGLPMHKQSPVQAARRNERERKRVKYINETFDVLKEHLPDAFQIPKVKNKEMSKVEILRGAIDYIQTLEELLTKTTGMDFEGEFAALIQASDSVDESKTTFGGSSDLYPNTPDPVTDSSATSTPSGHSSNGSVMGNPESVCVNPASFTINTALLNVSCTPSVQLPGTPSGHTGQSSLAGTPSNGQYNNQSLPDTPSTTYSRSSTPSSGQYNYNIQLNHQNTPSEHINRMHTSQIIQRATLSHQTLPQLIPSAQQDNHIHPNINSYTQQRFQNAQQVPNQTVESDVSSTSQQVNQVQQNRNTYTLQTFQNDQQSLHQTVKAEILSSNQQCTQTVVNVKPSGQSMSEGDVNSNMLNNNNNSSFVNNNTNPSSNDNCNSINSASGAGQPYSYTLNLDCGYLSDLNFTPNMPSPALSGYTPSLCSPAPSIASIEKVAENVDFTDLTSLLMGFD